MRKRLLVLNLLFVAVTALLIVRFFSLQVISAEFYQKLALNQHQDSKTLNQLRGQIYIHDDKNGELVPVAINIKKDLVFAVPQEITDHTATARTLARTLGMSESEILSKISDQDRKWIPIKKGLTESESAAVKRQDLDGVYLEPETVRFYPENDFASQVLGFVGFEGDEKKGQYGVEGRFELELAGRPGYLSLEEDPSGSWITGGYRNLLPAEDGADLVLTLDRSVQFKAEEIAKATKEIHQADSVSIIVLDPSTGAVRAMANSPSFNPNTYNQAEDISIYVNPTVSNGYEPGSVFKAFTMAAALDAEVVSPDKTYEDHGSVSIDGYTIKNSDGKSHGIQTMTQVLEESLNTGIIFVQDQLGAKKFLDKIRDFGFGKPSGIELPAEAPGNLSNLVGGGDIHYATAAYGQGITVTPLQLARGYAIIANGGRAVDPYLLGEIRYPDGREESFSGGLGDRVVSSRAANTLGAMLVSVVENGHGKRAGVSGYYIAGKTGTAQVAKPNQAGYDPDVTIGTFAGFGPIEDPKFVIVVRVDNPKTVKFAESTAAPAFGELAQFLLNYYQVPPSR
jgi:cell division protein FtsI/penicillin-binding protein 2